MVLIDTEEEATAAYNIAAIKIKGATVWQILISIIMTSIKSVQNLKGLHLEIFDPSRRMIEPGKVGSRLVYDLKGWYTELLFWKLLD